MRKDKKEEYNKTYLANKQKARDVYNKLNSVSTSVQELYWEIMRNSTNYDIDFKNPNVGGIESDF